MMITMSSYLDIGDNTDSGLVDILSSLTGIKFNSETSQEYVGEGLDGKLRCTESLIVNSDPMLGSNAGGSGSTSCDSSYMGEDVGAWQSKPVDKWTTEDVLYWVSHESEKAGLFILDADLPSLCRLSGADLIQMTLQDFNNKMTNVSFAKQLYDSLQNNVLNPNNRNNIDSDVLTTLRTCSLEDNDGNEDNYLYYSYNECDNMSGLSISSNDDSMELASDHDSGVDSCSDSEPSYDTVPNLEELTGPEDVVHLLNNNINVILSSLNMNRGTNSRSPSRDEDCHYNWSSHWTSSTQSERLAGGDHVNSRLSDSTTLSFIAEGESQHGDQTQPIKKRPGRPRGIRKPKPEKIGRIWEFLRDLLHDPKYNPSVICWEDYDLGTFKFVDSNRVAQLWGSKRENSMMTFDKFSRAMRYYYKGKILIAVQKRLVYQFGTNATGWRIANPILR